MSEELTPQQTDAVRRALRAARHDAPVPDEVAARLDDRLAELVAERHGVPATYATVIPTDRFRRHNRRMTLLVAAAATVVVGVGATQLLGGSGEDSASTADRGSVAESAAADSDAAGREPTVPPTVAGDTKSLNFDNLDGLLSALPATTVVQLASAGYTDLRPLDPAADALASITLNKQRQDSAEQGYAADRHTPSYAASGCMPFARSTGPWEDLDASATTTYVARRNGRPLLLVIAPGPRITAYPCGGGEPTPIPLD